MPVFIVKKSESGLALAEFLQRRLPAAPPAYLKQILKKGKVCRPDGTRFSSEDVLSSGESILLPESRRLLELLAVPQAAAAPLPILYESREILIVDKPAGLAVHTSLGHENDNLTQRVDVMLGERGAKLKTAPIHRLDLETSGPVMFGKGKQACGQLGQLFMRREVEKYYLALVSGKTAGSGRIESQIEAKGKEKQACTEFRKIAGSEQASLLEIQLHTGRQHQIRKQLAEQGHPLFGDSRYRGPCPQDLPRMFLHCCRLAFVDPFCAAPVEINSPLPDDLATFLARLKIEV